MLSQTSLKIIVLATLLIFINSAEFLITKADAQANKKAALTTYTSYAACCKNNPNYDPKASKEECDDYSACKYSGDFAAIGHKSFDWVKTHNIVAFYDDSDPTGKNFKKKYGNKTIHLTKNGKTFDADTCGNKDCNGCCRKNSKNGYLVDIEYWTVMKNLGSIDQADGLIEFTIDP